MLAGLDSITCHGEMWSRAPVDKLGISMLDQCWVWIELDVLELRSGYTVDALLEALSFFPVLFCFAQCIEGNIYNEP